MVFVCVSNNRADAVDRLLIAYSIIDSHFVWPLTYDLDLQSQCYVWPLTYHIDLQSQLSQDQGQLHQKSRSNGSRSKSFHMMSSRLQFFWLGSGLSSENPKSSLSQTFSVNKVQLSFFSGGISDPSCRVFTLAARLRIRAEPQAEPVWNTPISLVYIIKILSWAPWSFVYQSFSSHVDFFPRNQYWVPD